MEILINKTKTEEQSILSDTQDTKRYNQITNSVFFNKNTKSEEISIQNLKVIIEDNLILNYPYNFLSLDKTKQAIPPIIIINLVDNVNTKVSEDLFEHYNKNTGQITITEKLLFNNVTLPSSFPECLNSTVGQAKLLIFAILHEIGHAIHHQIYLKQNSYLIPSQYDFNNNDFLNLIANNAIYLLGQSDNDKKYDINHAIKYSIKEGFADLYACVGLTQIYPQEVALNFIQEVIEARETSNSNYYTINSLKQLKENIEEHKFNLNNFEDLHSYIDKTISHTALKTILIKLSSNNEEQVKHNNAFTGFLKSLFEKFYEPNILEQAQSINEVIQTLDLNDNDFNIDLNHVTEDKNCFDRGYEFSQSCIYDIIDNEFLNLSTKIQSIRQNSLDINQKSIKLK